MPVKTGSYGAGRGRSVRRHQPCENEPFNHGLLLGFGIWASSSPGSNISPAGRIACSTVLTRVTIVEPIGNISGVES